MKVARKVAIIDFISSLLLIFFPTSNREKIYPK